MDDESFELYVSLEYDLSALGRPNLSSSDDHAAARTLRELDDSVSALRSAVPFSEGERRWFVNVPNGPDDLPFRDRLPNMATVVYDAGIRRVVNGADVVTRWSQWRRELGPFTGQNSLYEAEMALLSIGHVLFTDAELVQHWRDHRDLRDLRRRV